MASPPYNPTILLLTLPLLILSSLLTPSVACNPSDKAALLRIKSHFKNASPLATWDPKTDCCHKWHDVGCSDDGRVTSLAITGANDVAGEIPPAVADLPFLTNLQLFSLPNLTGTIPSFLTRLTKLKTLALSDGKLTGPVPSFLSQIKTLESIDLVSNSLTGSIPPSLSSLPLLTNLNLEFNRLTGSIPSTFGSFKGLTHLTLQNNLLSGPIPSSLGHGNFRYIDLSNNKFTGDASFFFGENKPLENIALTNNRFHFDFSNVVIPKGLADLSLSNNMIFGSLPKGVGRKFDFIDVSHNQLCGPIPNGDKLYKPYEKIRFEHNKCLCGFPLSPCK